MTYKDYPVGSVVIVFSSGGGVGGFLIGVGLLITTLITTLFTQDSFLVPYLPFY